jgi:hypothetical protein
MTADRADTPRAPDPTHRGDLAARQAALVAALVGDAPVPDGFDPRRLAAVRQALLRKRAGQVASAWPVLAAGCQWPDWFTEWAAGRPPQGGLRDGFDFARWLRSTGRLPDLAAAELATREALWRYDGQRPPRRRRLPALRRVGGTWIVQVLGRAHRLRG